MLKKQEKRIRRHRRIRAKIFGTSKIPRLSVFRSVRHISIQLIDDDTGKTLAAVNDQELKKSRVPKMEKEEGKKDEGTKRTAKIAVAYNVGKLIAEKAIEKNIKKVVFDRGGYQYHGRVKAIAEGAREGGLKF